MNTAPDGREVIPGGEQPFLSFDHVLPIAKFLIEERGHLPIDYPQDYGFNTNPGPGGFNCHLTREITQADWDAINQRFVIPDNIQYHLGLIRDGVNWMDIMGTDTYISDHGIEPIENQEAEIRERDAKLDPPPYKPSPYPPA